MNSKKIHKTVILSAPLKTIWWKWTTHEGLKTFFGVDNRIELALVGPYEIFFLLDARAGAQGGEGNQVLSFLPEQMLTFSWNAPPTIPEIRNHHHKTWVVLQFKAIGNEQTELVLDHLGWLECLVKNGIKLSPILIMLGIWS